ncbi:2283_t:CDS:2, partial [Racocetra persica]
VYLIIINKRRSIDPKLQRALFNFTGMCRVFWDVWGSFAGMCVGDVWG